MPNLSVEYILKRRKIMEKLEIVIGQIENKMFNYYEDTENFIFSFPNEIEFLNFLKEPNIKAEDFTLIDDFSLEEMKCVLKNTDINDLLNKSNIIVILRKLEDLPTNLLKDGKRIILDVSKLDYKDIYKILTSSNISDNVLFKDRFNQGTNLTLKEMIQMYELLLCYTKEIKEKNYSPLEAVFYIYNVVKKRIYKMEDEQDSLTKSRSLNEVLNGDNIVCVGYSNIFTAICDMIGIHAEEQGWKPIKDNESGHSSVILYLNDNKYNIKGIYGIDATWDSKEDEEDITYQNNISNFLLPISYEEKNKRRFGFEPGYGSLYYRFMHASKLFGKIPKEYLRLDYLSKIYEYLGVPFDNTKSLEDIKEELIHLGNKGINPRKIKDCINLVTPKSEEEMDATMNTCIHQKIEEEKEKENRLLKLLLTSI